MSDTELRAWAEEAVRSCLPQLVAVGVAVLRVLGETHAAAVDLGRRGGLKGGPARAAKLTPEQRSASAQKAAKSRWSKPPAAPDERG